MVRGELQGKRRVFLLDTGWSMTTLDRSIARKLKTPGEPGVSFKDFLLGKTDDRAMVLLNLQLGQVTFTNQPAVSGTTPSDGELVSDGVLGADFLFRNHGLVDYPGLKLWLRPTQPSKSTE
jgi:hypothetical protein